MSFPQSASLGAAATSQQGPSTAVLPGAVLGGRAMRAFLRMLMRVYLAMQSAGGRWGRRRSPLPASPATFLLTLTFHADNWALAHLRPLAMSRRCRHITVVATTPLPPMDKVTVVSPPAWLIRTVGRVPARLATFAWLAIRTRPDYVGGFHLLFNGLLAALVAAWIGARSVYFCVGGPAEVLDGGLSSENRLFEKIGTPDPRLEAYLLAAVRRFDRIITMGHRAKSFFQEHGIATRIDVASGGIDARRFQPSTARDIDVIVVARMAPIKRLDLFLSAVRVVADQYPGVRAVLVGEGPLRSDLEKITRDLGLDTNVEFAGHQSDVGAWLARSRVFMLTSDSEGLALSLMEAMLCGAVPIVSDVGELSNLVANHENGYIVAERRGAAFAKPLLALLTDPALLARSSARAIATARRHELGAAAAHWDQLLSDRGTHGQHTIGGEAHAART